MSTTQPPGNVPEIRRLEPLLEPGHTYASVTDKIAAVVLTRPPSTGWIAGFAVRSGAVL
jgi:molybdopterin-containing oxidoreductase family membrane subunit